MAVAVAVAVAVTVSDGELSGHGHGHGHDYDYGHDVPRLSRNWSDRGARRRNLWHRADGLRSSGMDQPNQTNQPSADLPREGESAHAIGVASFVAFLLAFFILFHWNYPDTGHDFGGILVKMIEGTWHFHHRGLAIPRYAVHVCGGSVLYGNPEDMFYSPAQMLSLLLDPWLTIQLTLCLALIAGYIGWYRVGCDILRLPKAWAHLLALVLVANGFYFLQMLSGHFMFHALALLGWFILLIFETKQLSIAARAMRVIAFALLSAYALFAGSWFTLYLLAIGFFLVLPLDLFFAPAPGKRMVEVLIRICLFGGAAVVLTGSKLVAIYSFMRFFPRKEPLQVMESSHFALKYIAKALWGIPQNGRLLADFPGYVHERSMLMAPITMVGLGVGLMFLARRLFGAKASRRYRWFAALYGASMLVVMLHIVRGHGFVAEALHRLPVGASQRLSSRYLYLFALLLSAAGVWSLATLMKRESRGWNTAVILIAAVTTVAVFVVGYVKMLPEVGLASNMRDHRAHWRRVDRGKNVGVVTGFTNFDGATGKTCYEPVLNSAGTPSLVLHEGSVYDQQDGYFNLMKVACYQYPEENQCRPGDRIPVADLANLNRFTQGAPVTWRVSSMQEFADVMSGLALVIFLVALRYLRGIVRREAADSNGA